MSTPLRVLLVQSSDDDADVILNELRKGGYDPEHTRVDSRSSLQEALSRGKWELVIADFHINRLDGLSALALVRLDHRDIPFVVVSRALGEETAVAVMKAGAADCVSKGNLSRLVPVVSRELRAANDRRTRHRRREAVRRNEEWLLGALAAAETAVWEWDRNSGRMTWSSNAGSVLGIAEGSGPPGDRGAFLAIVADADRPTVRGAIDGAIDRGVEFSIRCGLSRAGRELWFDLRAVRHQRKWRGRSG